MTTTLHRRPQPTVADAQRVADAFAADPNVVQVLLFGSVACGTQNRDSDIDMVVVHRDLEYDQQLMAERRLETVGQQLVGWPVHVHATDVPEWSMRTALRNSFEAGLLEQPWQALHAKPWSDDSIDWGKQRQRPANELAEAVDCLEVWLAAELLLLALRVTPAAPTAQHNPTVESEPPCRLTATLPAAMKVTALALWSFAKLVAGRTLDEQALRTAGHQVGRSLQHLATPHRALFTDGLRELRLTPDTIACWRPPPSKEDSRASHDRPPTGAERHIERSTRDSLTISSSALRKCQDEADPAQVAAVAVAVCDAVTSVFEAAAPASQPVAGIRDKVNKLKAAYQLNGLPMPE